MTKRFGFTLAEVLITLGIIGVVAAMTMPTLINQTNGAQYKAAYKKALSAIAQGVTLNVALDDESFADVVANSTGGSVDKVEGKTTVASLLNSRMNVVNVTTEANKGYTITKPTGGLDLPTTNTALFFNDGSMFAFNSADGVCAEGTKICQGYVDVNGQKGPNKSIACSTGTTTAGSTTDNKFTQATAACTVNTPTDVYPVVYYDQTIQPATNAAAAVLYGK